MGGVDRVEPNNRLLEKTIEAVSDISNLAS
jgi:hypothetical protein